MSHANRAQDKAVEAKNNAGEAAVEAARALGDKASEAKQGAQDAASRAQDKAVDVKNTAQDKAAEARDVAEQKASEAKEQARATANKAQNKAIEAKDSFIEKLRADGVENPAGLGVFAFTFLFLGMVPVTTWLSQPNGLVESAVNGLCRTVAFIGSAGSTSRVAQTGKIAALSTLYLATTFALTGAGSAAAVDAGNQGGRDNNHPRAQESNLKGLPLRLLSAHKQMVETFPAFALTAALTQAMAPADQTMINMLGLHVISKVFIYYPSYIFNIGASRSVAHILGTASVIGAALTLAKRPILAGIVL